ARIIDTGVLVAVGSQLIDALDGLKLHVFFAAEVQAAGGTGLDAGRLQPRANAVRAQRAFVDFLRRGVEFGDVEGTAAHAVLAADTVLLVEVHDAVAVLNDGAVRGTGFQTPGILAVHALVLAHQPVEFAVTVNVFPETDQVPEVPGRIRHSL